MPLPHRRPAPRRRTAARGFTLVELLVALFVLSLVAILSWRGLDGMVRTQSQTQQRADDVLALQVALAQWQADLDAIVQLPQLGALEWNGRVLRMTRRNTVNPGDGVRVAAWTRRLDGGQPMWLRWQSPPLRTRGEVDEAWRRADAWSENPGDAERAGEVALLPLADWQLFFHRGGTWTNPQSNATTNDANPALAPDPPATPATPAAAAAPAPTARGAARPRQPAALPDGVRLVLQVAPGHPLAGQLSIDWVGTGVTGGRTP
ncbi:prepilin-type N-terminal cleavage/methylation domain-containing protein [Ramlibacter sp. AN1015]|uniref:PulJ/GspJ family protein n=1 Tax=Ramlibacter sp. AN1015 TaxID=3133428 RepID=UPI0030C4E5C7